LLAGRPANVDAIVAVADGVIVGHAMAADLPARICPDVSRITDVGVVVADAWQRRGVGGALMRALIEDSERHGVWTLQSSIFPENHASVALHLKHGFREVGRRERIAQHHGVWRDTVVLERRSRAVGES
jgi:phosphinothricin acetyltransferase